MSNQTESIDDLLGDIPVAETRRQKGRGRKTGEPLPELPDSPLKRIVDALKGGVSEMGRDLGVSRQAVYVWLHQGWVPPERAVQIESRYGGRRFDYMNPVILFGSEEQVKEFYS